MTTDASLSHRVYVRRCVHMSMRQCVVRVRLQQLIFVSRYIYSTQHEITITNKNMQTRKNQKVNNRDVVSTYVRQHCANTDPSSGRIPDLVPGQDRGRGRSPDLIQDRIRILKANSHRHARRGKAVLSVWRPLRWCELDSRQLKTVADRKFEV